MAGNVAHATASAHVRVPDNRVRTAKTDLRKAEKNPHWVQWGACMREVMRFADLTLEEFAYALGKNERQIARQLLGDERPQLEVVLAHDRFQGPMVIALARITSGVEVDTVIHIRRKP